MCLQQRVTNKLLICLIVLCSTSGFGQNQYNYPSLGSGHERFELVSRFPVLDEMERVPVDSGSFADWLRHYPLLPGKPDVLLYNGEKKYRQDVHSAVLDLPLPAVDLQQCADAVMRMRAEYLYNTGQMDAIQFNYTSGDKVGFKDWYSGRRPKVSGNSVSFYQSSAVEPDRDCFESYLKNIFTYAGTHSLENELVAVQTPQPGDVLIEGGFPGHAVLIMDVAVDKGGNHYLLLAQSFMPAQQMHVLTNLFEPELGSWFRYQPGETVFSPQWTFETGSLHRFP